MPAKMTRQDFDSLELQPLGFDIKEPFPELHRHEPTDSVWQIQRTETHCLILKIFKPQHE